MRTLLTLCMSILFPVSFAQEGPALAVSSAQTLEGALEGNFDSIVTQYVPGYGLQINARWLGGFNEEDYLTTVSGVLTGLSPLVRGLTAGDVVSVSYSLSGFGGEPPIYYTVRVIPNQADSIEVFVNGSVQR